MSAITLDGEIVHYEVLGRGRPLFFLHGWVGSWRYWIPTMQAASISFRAYSLDLWGFGDTNKNPNLYSIEQQAQLLNRFMEELGIMKIALVGHGLGALAALTFAAHNPTLVDRLMVTSLPVKPDAISSRLSIATISDLVDWLLGRLPANDAARLEAPKADPRALTASFEDLERIDPMQLAVQAATPCLFVHGQNDPAVMSPTEEFFASLPDTMHYIIFEQSGHFPMLDEANKYHRLLSDFLALQSGESPRQLQLKEEWKRRVR